MSEATKLRDADIATDTGADAGTEDGSKAPFFAPELTNRQKLTRRMLRFGAGLAVIGLVAVAAMFWRSAPASMAARPSRGQASRGLALGSVTVLPVTTIVVERVESYARQRSYTGLLRESRRSQLSFQRGGELLELLVDQGDAVATGQALGRLDARHIRARRAMFEAEVAVAKAELEELEAGPRKEAIAAKRAELRAQESQTQVLAGQLKRRKQLVRSASVSREEYETFLHKYEAAVAREEVVKRQLDEMLAGTRVEKIAAQRARLGQLDAQLTDLAHDLEDTRLVAPFSGHVSQRMVDEGNVVAAGAPVLEVIDDANIEAWIGLPPAAALTLEVGDEYELLIAGKPVRAVVRSLAPDVQRTSRTRNVILRLKPSATLVLPGQVVRLMVTEQVEELGFWVPTTALARGTRGLWSLYVVDEGADEEVVTRRNVEVLDTVGSDSFVRGTLQSGDAIVASGTHRVVVGQRVRGVRSENFLGATFPAEPRP